MEVKPEWLVEIAPHYYKKKEVQKGAAGDTKGVSAQFVMEIE